jgi:hypothetical protein
MNVESSRSHLIISVVIESTNLQTQSSVKGKLSFVDLAGSERIKKSGSTGEQLKEAQVWVVCFSVGLGLGLTLQHSHPFLWPMQLGLGLGLGLSC